MWQIYYQASISLIICSTHVIYIAVASTQVNRIDEFCRRGDQDPSTSKSAPVP